MEHPELNETLIIKTHVRLCLKISLQKSPYQEI